MFIFDLERLYFSSRWIFISNCCLTSEGLGTNTVSPFLFLLSLWRVCFSFLFSDHLFAQMLGAVKVDVWRDGFPAQVYSTQHACVLAQLESTPPESLALMVFPPLHPWTHHCLGQQDVGRRCRDTCKANSNTQHGFCLAFLHSPPEYQTSCFQEAQAPRRDITWVFEPKASKSQHRSTTLSENGHQGVSNVYFGDFPVGTSDPMG